MRPEHVSKNLGALRKAHWQGGCLKHYVVSCLVVLCGAPIVTKYWAFWRQYVYEGSEKNGNYSSLQGLIKWENVPRQVQRKVVYCSTRHYWKQKWAFVSVICPLHFSLFDINTFIFSVQTYSVSLQLLPELQYALVNAIRKLVALLAFPFHASKRPTRGHLFVTSFKDVCLHWFSFSFHLSNVQASCSASYTLYISLSLRNFPHAKMCKMLNKYFHVLLFIFYIHFVLPLICKWRPPIFRCTCCTWQSSTSGTCSYIAILSYTGECWTLAHSTSHCTRPSLLMSHYRASPVSPCSLWPCPLHSSLGSAPGTPGLCLWVSGSLVPVWDAGMRAVWDEKPGPAPPAPLRCSALSAGSRSLWTWEVWSSMS